MKRIIIAFACLVCTASPALALGGELPAPRTEGGLSVFEALEKRSSAPGRDFPSGAISDEELATLLWAATGRNRQDKGWTVPMAMGTSPYCSVYVVAAEGAYRYEWKEHSLRKITSDDITKKIAKQEFIGAAPYILIFVADTNATDKLGSAGLGEILVGAMTQNVYLAAQALDIGGRYVASINADEIRTALSLEKKQVPICVMPIGHF